jgi:alkylated DNA repair dioxygenase AlkB
LSLLPITLAGADLAFDANFLGRAEADAALTTLATAITWEQHRIRLFGREHAAPRLSCWIGDPGASYVYSRTRFEPQPWPAPLAALRDRVERACGACFNAVLANLYRGGDDAMGWHADDEPELGPQPIIASLSLGASRRFLLRGRDPSAIRLALELGHGSLLLMRGDTQRHYRHALPRTRRPCESRINLTFRRILGVPQPAAG